MRRVVGSTGWACAGLTAILAADWCSRDLGIPLPNGPVQTAAYFLTVIAAVGALLALACRRGRPLRNDTSPVNSRIVIALGATALVGRVLRGFAAPLPADGVLVCTGTALYAAAEAILLLVWLDVLARYEATHVPAVICGAYALVCLVYFCLRGCNAVAGAAPTTIVIAALPLIGSLLYVQWTHAQAPAGPEAAAEAGLSPDPSVPAEASACSTANDSSAEPSSPAQNWGFPVFPAVLMIAYTFVFYFTLALSVGPSPYGSIGMGVVAATACLAAILWPAKRVEVGLLGAALPLMVSGLLVLGYLQTGRSGAVLLTNAGNVAFTLFMLVSLAGMCHRLDMNAYWVFGIVESARLVSTLAGRRLGYAFVAAMPVGSEGCGIAVAGAIVALVLLASVALLAGDRLFRSFGMQPVEKDAYASGGEQVRPGNSMAAEPDYVLTMTYSERIVWECSKAARLFGLTQREEEVLELLVQGLSINDIAERTFISYGTAKTHIGHIYAKLDVHSREAAVALTRKVATGQA